MAFKFCPECGSEISGGNRFCSSCGNPLAAEATGAGGGFRLAGLITLVVLLSVGGGFWGWERFGAEERALKPGERRADDGEIIPVQAAQPPFQLPDDIKNYIAGLAKQAEATPEDAANWVNLAGVYYRASRLDRSYLPKARAAYAHLVELDDEHLVGLRGLGNISYDQGQQQEAIAYYERYLALDPENPEVRTDLGTMFFGLGDQAAALREWNQVITTSPDFYQAYFNKSILLDKEGRRDEALEELEKAQELAKDETVRRRLAVLLSAARESGKSLEEAAGIAAQRIQAEANTATAATRPTAPSAIEAPADTFRGTVEHLFRTARVAGPKVVAVAWPTEDRVRVEMAGFPMEQMPEVMKNTFLGKMNTGLRTAETKYGIESPVSVEIVDQPTGQVMAEISPESPGG